MKTIENAPIRGSLVLAALVLIALAACGREAGPSGVRKRPDDAAVAPIPSAAAEGSARPAIPSAAAEGSARTGIEPTTAEQLIARVRSSGKRATLVNAWASWCGPCRREVPMLHALSVNLKLQGVDVVLVTVDDAKDEAKALSFLKDNGITLQSYIVDGSIGDFKAGINPRWRGMLPASFLFDGAGELVHFWGGEAFEQEIVPVVESFLAGRVIESETRYGLAPGKVE
jgi:thiol-disulfide isomerase/thioredoxin